MMGGSGIFLNHQNRQISTMGEIMAQNSKKSSEDSKEIEEGDGDLSPEQMNELKESLVKEAKEQKVNDKEAEEEDGNKVTPALV
eukprot:CAMPEP_0172468306 /NCGR_PEP_ID=MMETSP1065-20121228/60963_1 /TAXON_ID=265537 /ORGANISM="Amphiprora paludosa, Strain CCMP125" /LENGTH=83 /DNA_ID=CAMNT_0013225669 /DNA_START=130 /DNA_END=377 /DNA_ORIENTATION=+